MKAERVELEAAYILHARPYRETSQLLEILARHHGRLGIVARGARGPRARWRALLQPFQPLHLSWSGRGPLFTLRNAEPAAPPPRLQGARLLSAYYLNELLLGFTTRGDPHPELFAHYTAAVAGLASQADAEISLRRFELALLHESGYGLDADRDAQHGAPIDPDQRYCYQPERGAIPVDGARSEQLILTGASLQAIAAGSFRGAEDLRLAKQLLRQLLDHHLGYKPLQTRRIFAELSPLS